MIGKASSSDGEEDDEEDGESESDDRDNHRGESEEVGDFAEEEDVVQTVDE